jgi:hypothetical protein
VLQPHPTLFSDSQRVSKKIRAWNYMLHDVTERGLRVVLCDSFFVHDGTLVDINPYRLNHDFPGTGNDISSLPKVKT